MNFPASRGDFILNRIMCTIEIFCCQNPLCPVAGVRGKGNLRLHGWSDRNKTIRCLCCRTCKKCFSERKGTVLERSRLTTEKAVSILDHLREGNGVRGTGRLVKVHQNTVMRYARIAGEHAYRLHDELVEFSPKTRELQFDEKWSFVFKKEAHCEDDEKTCGDIWDHTVIDPEHRLLLSIVPGKRTGEMCQKVVDEAKKRTHGRTDIFITSDAHAPYKTAIQNAYSFQSEQPDGTTKQVMPNDLCYATVNKTRKGGRVIDVTKTLVFGTLVLLFMFIQRSFVSWTINTSFVERHNLTDRNQNARKGRKTMRFSKDWDTHIALTYFVSYSYNFCWPVRTLRIKNDSGRWQKRTPAMSAGLSDHVWSTSEWILYPVRPCTAS